MTYVITHKMVEMSDDTKKLSFISSFSENIDKEIVSILMAWITHLRQEEFYVMRNFIQKTMMPNPLEYILDYNAIETSNKCFFNTLTILNLNNLICRIQANVIAHGNIKNAYTASRKKRHKYAHETLANIFGGGTGFQTSKTQSTYYRLNLLIYWLTKKLGVWNDINIGNSLLPCNDLVFLNAYKKGFIKKPMKSNLTNTIALTKIAKDIYGKDDFYTLYEKLKSYD